MSAFHFLLAYLLSAVFLLGPGYAFLAAVRVPTWYRLVLSPLVSAAWVAGLGIVFAWVGLRFNGWSVLLATVVVAGLVAAAVRFTRAGTWLMADRDKTQVKTPPAIWIALGTAMVVSFIVWFIDFVHPLSGYAAVTRAYDVPWHASIIKQFIVSGNGSSLTAAAIEHTTGSSFYPAAWHDQIALVAGLGHFPIFGGINAGVFAELTLVWPLSITAFVTVLFGRRTLPVFLTAVVASLFVAFPLQFLIWGIIYSNLYGFALLPGLLALCVLLFSDKILGGMGRRIVAILFVIGFVGDAIAQPNAIFTLAVLMLPMILGVLYRWVAARPRFEAYPRVAGVAACVALVVVGGLAWVGLAHTHLMQRTTTLDRATAGGLRDAVEGAALQGFSNGHHQLFLALLILIGALVLLFGWRRRQWLIVSHVLICLCYVVSASAPIEQHLHWLRMNLTGYWYNDYNRLAAATVLTAIPLAVVAVDATAELMAKYSIMKTPSFASAGMIMALMVSGIIMSVPFSNHRGMLSRMAGVNSELYGGRVTFLQKVATIVPKGQVVANEPFDGSAYAWSLDGIDTFFKSYSQNWIGSMSPAMFTVANHLDQAASDPSVCSVLKQYDVTYALQMTTKGRLVNRIWHKQRIWQGMHVTPKTPGFSLVASGPGAKLYKITACGQ